MQPDLIASYVSSITTDLQAQVRQMALNGAPLSQDQVDAIRPLATLKCAQICASTGASTFHPIAATQRMLELSEKYLQLGDISRAVRSKTI